MKRLILLILMAAACRKSPPLPKPQCDQASVIGCQCTDSVTVFYWPAGTPYRYQCEQKGLKVLTFMCN